MVTLVALLVAACGGASTHHKTAGPASPTRGGTATFAELAGASPNWILPIIPLADLTPANSSFENLMYRPLYWFGQSGQPTLDPALSLAYPPVYSHDSTEVTVKLKDYRWSNGEAVSASDVLLFLHLVQADKTDDGNYVPGDFPDNIVSAHIDNGREVTFRLNASYSHVWFTDNELGQIVPLPAAWDRTASGPSNCATTLSDCPAVYSYLAGQARSVGTYGTNRLWQVVDGPWHLTKFLTNGQATFVPNARYSGSPKPRLSKFELLPFTSAQSELNLLRSGTSITVGYLPYSAVFGRGRRDVSQLVGNRYHLVPWQSWSIEYFEYNYNNPVIGPFVRQSYIREAMQHLVDQQAVVHSILDGYGYPTYGPVPTRPRSALISAGETRDPYPFSIGEAKSLLASHGWAVQPGGSTRCKRPGTGPTECGAGIKAGTPLTFTFQYWTGDEWMQASLEAFKSDASRAGITIDLDGGPKNSIISQEAPCKPSQPLCKWQVGEFNWGYSAYPTGEEAFQTKAAANVGSFSDPTIDRMITSTRESSDPSAMQTYEDYVAKYDPFLWWPNADAEITEVANNVRGATPLNPLLNITPENWYFVK